MSAREAILTRLTGKLSPAAIAAEADTLLIAPERPPVPSDALQTAFVARLREPGFGATVDQVASLAAVPDAIALYWTCNGFVPVTYLIKPPWLRTRAD